MDQAKVLRFMQVYQQNFTYKDDVDTFKLAICQVQLDNYTEAQRLFEKSCRGMLKRTSNPQLWRISGELNLLVNTCILSGRISLYPGVLEELETYKKTDRRADSLLAMYAYALMELFVPSQNDTMKWVQGLLKRPKVKETFAMGQALQAIVDGDQSALHNALTSLLKVHEGSVKHGTLRESIDGLLCVSAMSLAYVALTRNLEVEIESDYLSTGYLRYLLSNTQR